MDSSNSISIIIPAYNVSVTLQQCVESVLKQDLQNFEIIIIDDGSRDNTLDIIKNLAQNNKCISFITQKNGGANSARDLGWRLAKGEYIFFLDSDDSIPDGALSKMYTMAVQEHLDVLITAYNNICTGLYQKTRLNIESSNSLDIVKYILEGKISCGPWGRLFKRTLYTPVAFSLSRAAFKNEDLFMNIVLLLQADKSKSTNQIVGYNYTVGSGTSISRKKLSELGHQELVQKLKKALELKDNDKISNIEYYSYVYKTINAFFYSKGFLYKDKNFLNMLYVKTEDMRFNNFQIRLIRQCTHYYVLAAFFITYQQFIRALKFFLRKIQILIRKIN